MSYPRLQLALAQAEAQEGRRERFGKTMGSLAEALKSHTQGVLAKEALEDYGVDDHLIKSMSPKEAAEMYHSLKMEEAKLGGGGGGGGGRGGRGGSSAKDLLDAELAAHGARQKGIDSLSEGGRAHDTRLQSVVSQRIAEQEASVQRIQAIADAIAKGGGGPDSPVNAMGGDKKRKYGEAFRSKRSFFDETVMGKRRDELVPKEPLVYSLPEEKEAERPKPKPKPKPRPVARPKPGSGPAPLPDRIRNRRFGGAGLSGAAAGVGSWLGSRLPSGLLVKGLGALTGKRFDNQEDEETRQALASVGVTRAKKRPGKN